MKTNYNNTIKNKIKLVNISIIENLVTVIYHKAKNAFLNKNVFSPVLKESSVCVALRWSGRLFRVLFAWRCRAKGPVAHGAELGFGDAEERAV